MRSNLEALAWISEVVGKDPYLVQASGGNTSFKEAGYITVKASGKLLCDAGKENIFMRLDLKAVHALVSSESEDLGAAVVETKQNKRASIETSMHAIMRHPYVIHTHPVDVIARSIQVEGRALVNENLKGISWKWVEYARPGLPLSKQIGLELKGDTPDVLILCNHGLVVGGGTAEEALKLHSEVVERLRLSPREIVQADLTQLKKIVDNIPGSYIPQGERIHTLGTDKWSLTLLNKNPPYPDHVVFCGTRPWIYGDNSYWPPEGTLYGIVPKVGVFLTGDANKATEEMLTALAEVYSRIPLDSEVRLLSDSQCNELVLWDAEKYRRKLMEF